MLAHILYCLLSWSNVAPLDMVRHNELAELLVAICLHESRCHPGAVGDGGKSRGAWQVRGRDVSASAALARVRWSVAACGDLSLYAGFGRCGGDKAVLASLMDPTLPRR